MQREENLKQYCDYHRLDFNSAILANSYLLAASAFRDIFYIHQIEQLTNKVIPITSPLKFDSLEEALDKFVKLAQI